MVCKSGNFGNIVLNSGWSIVFVLICPEIPPESPPHLIRGEELEGQMAQALAQVQGVMNAVSAGALSAGNVSGGAGGHM